MEAGRAPKRFSDPSPGAAAPKRRAVVPMACDSCRSRKIKCDGRRPDCSACVARRQACRYESELGSVSSKSSLRQENRALKHQLEDLRRQLAVARPRSHAETDPADVASAASVRGNGTASLLPNPPRHTPAAYAVHMWPSYHQILRATLPQTQSLMEFELMCKHPHAYHVLEPWEDPERVAAALLRFDVSPITSGYRDHMIRTVSSCGISPDRLHGVVDALPLPRRPGLPVALCDSRLRNLDIAYWTSVPISNDTAASVLSLYLENQHPILGTFDADLFVRDLVDKRLRFCSPVLVNAVLYYGCQAYTFFDETAPRLSWDFHVQAIKLWRAERSCDTLPNLAALQIMSLADSCNGHDREGERFFALTQDMAQRLDLFTDQVAPPSTGSSCDNPVSDELRFRSHIVWGTFAIMNAYAFYYRRPPTNGVPSLPIPGSPGFPLPDYMGSTTTLLCELWLVGREVAMLYANGGETITDHVPFAAVELKYQRLLAFGDRLWSSNAQIPHHAAILQFVDPAPLLSDLFAERKDRIWYHTVIVSLIQPWIRRQIVLRSFESAGVSPLRVHDASMRQLKRLMINFRLSYPQATYNIHWHLCLMYIANSVLAESDHDPEWQFYFMACLAGYSVLYPSFRLAELCFKGLLTMALERGKFPTAKAQQLLKELSHRGEHHRIANSHSGMRLDLNADHSWDTSGTVEDLASKFDSIAPLGSSDDESCVDGQHADADALFDELIRQDVDDAHGTSDPTLFGDGQGTRG